MTKEEIKAEAIILQSECKKEDLRILNKSFRAGKLKIRAGSKIHNQRLKRIFDHLTELIDAIEKNTINCSDAEFTYKNLQEQFSEYIKQE